MTRGRGEKEDDTLGNVIDAHVQGRRPRMRGEKQKKKKKQKNIQNPQKVCVKGGKKYKKNAGVLKPETVAGARRLTL